jgi:hypothetical protein
VKVTSDRVDHHHDINPDHAINDFPLFAIFVSEIWGALSRQDSHRQVKFDVFRCQPDDELKVKDGVTKYIRRFLGGVDILSR